MIFSTLVDLFLPRFNSDYSDFQSYLNASQKAKTVTYLKNDLLDPFFEKTFFWQNYRKENIENLILRSKLYGEMAIFKNLAEEFSGKISNLFQQNLNNDRQHALTFVPPDPLRIKQRGYHLPYILAQTIAKDYKIPCLDLLFKKRSTVSQMTLGKLERLENLEDVFEMKPETDFNMAKIDHLWVVDDILTTGSTLAHVGQVIKKNLPFIKLSALILAT